MISSHAASKSSKGYFLFTFKIRKKLSLYYTLWNYSPYNMDMLNTLNFYVLK